MENRLWKVGFLLFFLFSVDVAFSQTAQNQNAYFSGKYSKQPVITLREGFLNKTTYYLDGEKASSSEVANLLQSVESEDFRFIPYQRNKNLGTGLKLTGLAANTGSIAYLFTNELTSANIQPWFWVTFGSAVLQATGDIIIRNADRKIERMINDFNAYHYSDDPGTYLRMDVSKSFSGSKIDIYEGPMLLEKDQVLERFKSNEEAYRQFETIIKREKVSAVTNVLNSTLGFGLAFLAIGYERQSSTQNQLLLPLVFTGVGLNVFSIFFERRTRNLTREALYRYNYQ